MIVFKKNAVNYLLYYQSLNYVITETLNIKLDQGVNMFETNIALLETTYWLYILVVRISKELQHFFT